MTYVVTRLCYMTRVTRVQQIMMSSALVFPYRPDNDSQHFRLTSFYTKKVRDKDVLLFLFSIFVSSVDGFYLRFRWEILFSHAASFEKCKITVSFVQLH